ncbi:DUF3445 domain-containing protein [Rhodococcus sp. SORGH_AS_0301]|uniref:heme-dependent oxidative N-demethylase family protein n=1 Tax=Rhodococcus sp. SORGH_AS_0301 TaxID=3041780 RepID=UPI002788D79F|nr:DUF3445 domain-containing protein [Rhodococcus sp. SORGH_AS_0301]MDQ1179648.1 hypothetical protein [Rhodococcus sp. SORGH_AS_0301]
MTDLRAFPFPFDGDTYRYSTNLEPARTAHRTAAGGWGEHVVEPGTDYRDALAERARILARDPRRAVSLPHMAPAGWDALETVLTELHRSMPDETTLDLDDGRVRFSNRLSGTSIDVARGDPSVDPLLLAAGETPDDLVLLDTRGGELFADAGVVTFASGWSVNFALGASFEDIHGPVPRVRDEGVVARARAFLLGLGAGAIVRRTNWSLGVDHRLDASLETRGEWARARRHLETASVDEVGRRLCLRVEVQHLTRLAPSGAILFLIRTHQASLDELAAVPGWAERVVAVTAELPRDMADYKGLTALRPAIDRWWRSRRRAVLG